jgi:anaerobic sulfite reductase subunit C
MIITIMMLVRFDGSSLSYSNGIICLSKNLHKKTYHGFLCKLLKTEAKNMGKEPLKELDAVSLKNFGYMKQRQKDLFTVRLRIPCGNVTWEQLIGIGHIAKEFGRGYVHITTRQGIQIPNVNLNDLDSITEELKLNCTPPGSFGPYVRNIIACPGNLECTYGIIDTYGLGGMLDGEFFDEKMPVKMKFAVTGCPNGCAKPQENDFGVMGILKCAINTDKCSGCGSCSDACPEKAIIVEGEKAKIIWDKCKHCGTCVRACPSCSISEGCKGYKIFVGGKVGRNPKLGREFIEATSPQEVVAVFRKIINWSKKNTLSGERFGECLDRVGFENFKQEILLERNNLLQHECNEVVESVNY